MVRRAFSFSLCVLLVVASVIISAASAADHRVPGGASRMVIEPSSASLAGAKAQLMATALQRKDAKYTGSYQLKVTPYFFKSESGTLSVAVSDESLRKLAAGSAVKFAGSAVTTGSSKKRPITVKALPDGVGSQNGTLTISIATENGELLFTSSYALNGN